MIALGIREQKDQLCFLVLHYSTINPEPKYQIAQSDDEPTRPAPAGLTGTLGGDRIWSFSACPA
jgi:hypothetical protein